MAEANLLAGNSREVAVHGGVLKEVHLKRLRVGRSVLGDRAVSVTERMFARLNTIAMFSLTTG